MTKINIQALHESHCMLNGGENVFFNRERFSLGKRCSFNRGDVCCKYSSTCVRERLIRDLQI